LVRACRWPRLLVRRVRDRGASTAISPAGQQLGSPRRQHQRCRLPASGCQRLEIDQDDRRSLRGLPPADPRPGAPSAAPPPRPHRPGQRSEPGPGANGGEGEAKRLRPVERNVREREHVGGHSSGSSVIRPPAMASHVDATVGSPRADRSVAHQRQLYSYAPQNHARPRRSQCAPPTRGAEVFMLRRGQLRAAAFEEIPELFRMVRSLIHAVRYRTRLWSARYGDHRVVAANQVSGRGGPALTTPPRSRRWRHSARRSLLQDDPPLRCRPMLSSEKGER
jgi:hypothetical protein